jgi:CubicO group peptidase (beta-lactamase class C family)
MKRSYAQGLSALLLGFSLSDSAAIAAEASEPFHAERALALPATTACLENAVAAGVAQRSLSGIAAAVVLDGHIVYHEGFGTVSPASTQPVLPSTRFRIGSITKPMTATALLSLAEEGRIDLHAPVSRLLPGFALDGEPGWSQRITPHRLLSHQAGIADFQETDGPRDDAALAAAFYDPAFLQSVPLLVAPGTFYNYSNTNFMLAGLLVETAAGRPYREVMRRRVFKPLGMTRTTFLLSDVMADNDVASGVLGQTIVPPDAYDHAVARPAGYAWASVDDLARFMKFIIDGNPTVLSARMSRKMQTSQVSTRQLLDLEGYGYGLLIEKDAGFFDNQQRLNLYKGVKVVWHDGAIDGYTSLFATVLGMRFGYAALINGNYDNPGTDLIPCYQAAVLETIGTRLPPPAPWPGPDIQRDRFGDYVGQYADRIDLTGPATVTLTPGGDLSIRFPMLDEAGIRYDPILHPHNRDDFVWFVLDLNLALELTGIRQGHDGPVAYLRLRPTVLARTPSEQSTFGTRAATGRALDRRSIERALRAAAKEQAARISD